MCAHIHKRERRRGRHGLRADRGFRAVNGVRRRPVYQCAGRAAGRAWTPSLRWCGLGRRPARLAEREPVQHVVDEQGDGNNRVYIPLEGANHTPALFLLLLPTKRAPRWGSNEAVRGVQLTQ
eukprot:4080299-Pyramimonas_sp.AAC.2